MVDNVKTLTPGWLNDLEPNKRDVFGEAHRYLAGQRNSVYESYEANTGTWSNLDLSAQTGFTDLFTVVQLANRVIIRLDVAAVFRFNGSGNDPVTVAANASFEMNWLQVKSIHITTTGTTALKVIIV